MFLLEQKRRVHKDRTVSLDGFVYEVDAALVGEIVCLRYDPARPGTTVDVWHKGHKVQTARIVDVYANCHVKRDNDTRQLVASAAPRITEPSLRLRDLADTQRKLTDQAQSVDARLKPLEPQRVSLDGREFQVGPEERSQYDAAIGLVRRGDFAEAVAALKRPPVIWLSGQECTGCTETLLRTNHPTVENLILDLISLDYHEALSTPSGHLAEEAKKKAIAENKGKFILVMEGAVPMKDGGIYCQIGGRPVLDILKETAPLAMGVVAIGSCAAWGGIPSAGPNPTGAVGAAEALEGKSRSSIFRGVPRIPIISWPRSYTS